MHHARPVIQPDTTYDAPLSERHIGQDMYRDGVQRDMSSNKSGSLQSPEGFGRKMGAAEHNYGCDSQQKESSNRPPGVVTGCMRPLLCLAKVLGSFPAQNVFCWKRALSHRTLSLESTWSLLVAAGLTFIMVKWVWDATNFTDKIPYADATDYLVQSLFCRVQGLEALLVMLMAVVQTPNVCRLVNNMDEFEEQMRRASVVRCPKLMESSKRFMLTTAFVIVLSYTISPLIYLSLPDPAPADLVFCGVLEVCHILQSMPCIQLSVLTEALFLRFRCINMSLSLLFPKCPGNEMSRTFRGQQDLHRLEQLRLLLQRGRRLVEGTSDTFGLFLLIHYTMQLILMITVTYAIMFSSNFRSDSTPTVTVDVIFVIRLVTLTVVLSRVSKEATASLDNLREVSICGMDAESRVQHLISKLSSVPPEMNACNFFVISRSLLTSMVASATTYLVVLIQFRMSEKETHNATSVVPYDL